MDLQLREAFQKTLCFRSACAIDDPESQSVVITGGAPTLDYFNSSHVHVYGLDGFQKDLQPMNIGRMSHACTSFTSAGKKVRIYGN